MLFRRSKSRVHRSALSDQDAFQLLRRAGDILASSLDFHATLDNIAEVIIPALADCITIELADVSSDDRKLTYPSTNGSGPRVVSHVSFPLTIGEMNLGSITLGMTDGARAFDPFTMEVAAEIAHRAAIALHHSRLFKEAGEAQAHAEEQAIHLEEQAAELEQALAELELAESEQRTLIEAMRDVVMVLDHEGRYVRIPHTTPDLLYAPSEDLVGKRMHDVMPADVADAFLLIIRKALQTHEAVRTDYSLDIDGRTMWFSAVVSPMSNREVLCVSRDITAQHAAEVAVEESEARYRLLFDSNPMPMWVYDRQTLAFLSVNEAALQRYGFTRDEFARMTIADIRPPEDVARLREAVQDADSLHASGGWRHRQKDGSLIDVEIFAYPLEFGGHDAELVLALDVTARRRAEANLREGLELLRAVVEESPLAIVAVDRGFKITRWNPAAEKLLGWSTAEMVGTSYLKVVPDDRIEEFHAVQTIVERAGTVAGIDTKRRHKDGRIIDVSVSLSVLHDARGEIVGFTAILADFTERKRMETQLLQSQKMEAVGQLAGGVAHDFNNLLTAITSYSALLLEAIPDESPLYEDVVEIRNAADRAGVLTRQLLAFSRQQVIQPQNLLLNDVVAGMENMLRRLVRENIEFDIVTGEDVGVIHADRGQIEQVLMNLVVNARDAIAECGSIGIYTANTVANGAPHAVLTVTDTGVGMTAHVREHMFEPYFTTKQVGKGTGLGLATVYGIVKQAGGFVEVDSEPGKGARFDVYLPQISIVAADAAEGQIVEEPASGGHGRILLVEDNDVVRTVVSRILNRLGYAVVEATNGRDAVELFAQSRESIDLLITDIVMPEMSGPDLAHQLRQQDPSLAVLFMSGYSKDADTDKLIGPGSGYLEKPFTPAAIASEIQELLSTRPRRSRDTA